MELSILYYMEIEISAKNNLLRKSERYAESCASTKESI